MEQDVEVQAPATSHGKRRNAVLSLMRIRLKISNP
jgi:hypothetical protein